MKKIYIWGWWQGNNLGDNWIKKILNHFFPEAEFIDTSVQKFPKNSFVICGGGGLFIYDVINPWNKIPKKIEYGMLGLGAEFPHKSKNAIELYKKSKFFYVRDQHSLDCMHLSEIERSYDLTFAKPLIFSNDNETNINKVFFVWRDGCELLNNKNFYDYIKLCKDDAYDKWKTIIERHFAEVKEDNFQTQENNIDERLVDCGFVISGRYHGIVAAIQRGVPFIAIDICPKIRALTVECGLEEYCIKISDVSKIDYLINKAQNERGLIREKEFVYTKKANEVLLNQIANAKFEILKIIKPLNILHYGSYWMKKNDVVYTMADDLNDLCNLKKIDLKLYTRHPSGRIALNKPTENGNLCVLDSKRILKDVKRHKADVVVLNSGGLFLDDPTFVELKKQGVLNIGISLSDPDVFPHNGKVYANKFDIFYTNSKYSFLNEYPQTGANIRLMPFAASKKHHYFMPRVDRKYDVVVVAHAREDRLPIVEKLEKICKVGVYGAGWKNSLGEVNGLAHVKAINSGKMYLSFAKTVAGFDNVKVGLFEAMACNQVVITSYMEELQDYFDIGTEILCYKTEDELYDLISYYQKNEKEREKIRERGYARFLKNHTYIMRWNEVLKEIYKAKGFLT